MAITKKKPVKDVVKAAAAVMKDRRLDRCVVEAIAAGGRAPCAAWRGEGEE